MAHPAYDSRYGWQADAFTVVSFERGDGFVVYKGVWGMRSCCTRGHETPPEAAQHAANINRDRAIHAWARLVAKVD